MQTIEYKATFQERDGNVYDRSSSEIIRVEARNINSGYRKALRLALVPLGNGRTREISRLEFWQIR